MNYKTETINIDEKEYLLLIGKNALGNEEIIKIANQNDIWFHFDKVSGPHIIIQNNGDLIKKRYLNQIAGMLFELKPKVLKNTSVIYTEVKNVSLTNTLGMVITKNCKLIKF